MKHEFYVGQKVKVREWDDMFAEYGYLPGANAIKTPGVCFVSGMRPMCGHEYEIYSIDEGCNRVPFCVLKTLYKSPAPTGKISVLMLEPVEEIEFDETEFESLLNEMEVL